MTKLPTYIYVSGFKGGVGTTTLVASLGLALASLNKLTAIQTEDRDGLCAIFGCAYDGTLVTNNVRFGLNVVDLTETAHGYDYVIVDCGTTDPSRFSANHLLPRVKDSISIGTLENSYPALRMAARGEQRDVYAVLFTETSALQMRDVDAATGAKCVHLLRNPAIARRIDAGLLSSDLSAPRQYIDALKSIVRRIDNTAVV